MPPQTRAQGSTSTPVFDDPEQILKDQRAAARAAATAGATPAPLAAPVLISPIPLLIPTTATPEQQTQAGNGTDRSSRSSSNSTTISSNVPSSIARETIEYFATLNDTTKAPPPAAPSGGSGSTIFSSNYTPSPQSTPRTPSPLLQSGFNSPNDAPPFSPLQIPTSPTRIPRPWDHLNCSLPITPAPHDGPFSYNTPRGTTRGGPRHFVLMDLLSSAGGPGFERWGFFAILRMALYRTFLFPLLMYFHPAAAIIMLECAVLHSYFSLPGLRFRVQSVEEQWEQVGEAVWIATRVLWVLLSAWDVYRGIWWSVRNPRFGGIVSRFVDFDLHHQTALARPVLMLGIPLVVTWANGPVGDLAAGLEMLVRWITWVAVFCGGMDVLGAYRSDGWPSPQWYTLVTVLLTPVVLLVWAGWVLWEWIVENGWLYADGGTSVSRLFRESIALK